MRRVLAAVVLAVVLGSAAPALPQAPPVTRHVLPNGLVVMVREDPAVGVVAASLMVRTGSAFETAETAGVTNLLQRVMVKGTRKHHALALVEAAEELGGSVEASGDVDYAEIRGNSLARHWETLLGLIAEVALEPTLPPAEIEKERTLLLGQLQSRADQPFQRALDAAVADAYVGHPYAWPAVGRVESVKTLTHEALLERYASIYRADRMVLAVAGNAPQRRVISAAARLFKNLPGAGGRATGPTATAAPRAERRLIERDARQAQVLVGFLAPPLTHPDYAPMRVLGAVLGGGMSSRLFLELRDRRGLAYSTGVLPMPRSGPSLLVSYLGTAPANTEAAVSGMLAEIDRLRREPVDQRELARAKAWMLGNLAMDRRTSARHAWYLAFYELVADGWDWPDRYARAIEAVTVADLSRVAAHYLTQPTVVVLRPAEPAR
jgi:predicted Zn-dependent peptidase